jgi:hypothetical protein
MTIAILGQSSPAGNIDSFASAQASQANKSNAASSQHFGLPRAWALKANFANGRTLLRVAIDHASYACLPYPRRQSQLFEGGRDLG